MQESRKLIKVDRNGSKHWEVTCACSRCGGKGYISYYQFNEGGICFKCGGSGVEVHKEIERTAEYQAKLDAKRNTKLMQKQAEEHAESLRQLLQVFPENKIYFVLGNTYNIKEDIKAHNGRYDANNGWYFTCKADAEGFETFTLPATKVLPDIKVTKKGYWITMPFVEKPVKKVEHTSEYIGEVKEKLDLTVSFVTYYTFDSMYGLTYIYKFDYQGNTLIWKTSTALNIEEKGLQVNLKGTVKEHSEYNGEKQTVLTRCKVNVL